MPPKEDIADDSRGSAVDHFCKKSCSGSTFGRSDTRERKSHHDETSGTSIGGPADEILLAQARSSTDLALRRELLNLLFSRYHIRVARWCFRITGERNSAADLAQEILIKAYKSLDFFRGEAKFSTWLYSITRNHCVNESRQRAIRCESATLPIDDEFPSYPEFESKIEREEMVQQMRKLMCNNLDETEQKVMALHYGEEMPLDAITRLLRLNNASGAKSYIVSARRKLKAALERRQARSAAMRRAQ